MNRVFSQIARVLVVCALLAFATGCFSGDKKSKSNTAGDSSGTAPPGEPPGESGSEEDSALVYGTTVMQQDLPLPLVDDPDMPEPSALPGAPTTTPVWPAKSDEAIAALLRVERDADLQLTAGRRAAMAELGNVVDDQ